MQVDATTMGMPITPLIRQLEESLYSEGPNRAAHNLAHSLLAQDPSVGPAGCDTPVATTQGSPLKDKIGSGPAPDHES